MTSQQSAAARAREATPAVTVGTIVWVAVAATFIALRLGPVWQAPVGGPELIHLSGAWQASAGFDDARFIPSLAQAVAALLFNWTESESPIRLLAFAATATVPAALYLMRPALGDAGALLALAVLAFDGPAIALGSTASAMAFDVAVAAWLAVAILRGGLPPPVWGVAGFLVASSGPVTLPLIAGAAAVGFARRGRVAASAAAWGGAGVAVAVAAASFRYGFGFDGVRVPPLDLFAASYDEAWSTATTARLTVIYGAPVLLAGTVAGVVAALDGWRDRSISRESLVILAWAAAGLGWLGTSLTSHTTAPLVAVTFPLALLLGPALARAATAAWRAEWRIAGIAVPLAFMAFTIVYFVLADWARSGSRGGDFETVLLLLMVTMGVVALAVVALDGSSAPALFVAFAAPFAVLLVATSSGVAWVGGREPIPSPVSPEDARVLRNLAVGAQREQGGLIVVHPRYRDAAVWPMRGARGVVATSRIPPDATVLIWPPGGAPPDGFSAVAGDWSLLVHFDAPGDLLDYVRWLGDRTRVESRTEPVAVYVRTEP